MLVADGNHLLRAGRDGALADHLGIFHDQQHSHRAAAQRLRAEVLVLGRFLRHPEFRAIDREPAYAAAGNAIGLGRVERALVELDCLGPIPHRESRRDLRADMALRREFVHEIKYK